MIKVNTSVNDIDVNAGAEELVAVRIGVVETLNVSRDGIRVRDTSKTPGGIGPALGREITRHRRYIHELLTALPGST